MKLEIELIPYHYDLLKKICEYTDMKVNDFVKGLIICHIERFDSDMMEFLEKNLPDSYYDEYSGRYID